MNPASSGIIYFTEAPKKVCFLKELNVKEIKPEGFIKGLQGYPRTITEGNPPLSAKIR
jgi:hypothetical protein